MKDYFYTESLNVVAWLKSKGFEIKQLVKLDKRFVFYFEKTYQLKATIDEYNNNLPLKKFITAFKDVKEMMRNY